jgi:folate-dependent phosphoribosylglycinamide formyltransferase PurN
VFSLTVFVSGRGSNLNAIINSPKLRNLIKVEAVVGNKVDCPAFDVAKSNSIPVYSVGKKEGCISFDEVRILFETLEIDLIVLAGFLKLIPADFIRTFRNKIINIHPALF